MNTSSPRQIGRSRTTAITLSLLIACPFLAGCPAGHSGNGTPTASSTPAKYEDIARTFSTALVALEVKDTRRGPEEWQKATTLAPDEPAIWNNLGVSQLRKGDYVAAAASLQNAQQLAPQNPVIMTNIGLVEKSQGKFGDAVAALRKAMELDPNNLHTIYALTNVITQQGGNDAPAESVKLLNQILAKQPDNLVALLELTRSAARRGDKAAFQKGVDELTKHSQRWPDAAKAQLTILTQAAKGDIRGIAPQVVALSNLLKRTVEYRKSNAAVEGIAEEIGQPIEQLIKYPPLTSTPAAPDTGLTYTVGTATTKGTGNHIQAVYETGGISAEGDVKTNEVLAQDKVPPVLVATKENILPFDFDYNFQLDLAYAGPSGFRLEKGVNGKYTDVTAKLKLPPDIVKGAYTDLWIADIDMDGDLDLVLGKKTGESVVLQNNGDGTFKQIKPFPGLAGVVDFAWGDIDDDGDPDAVLIDGQGHLRVYTNERNGVFVARPVPAGLESVAAITIADIDNKGTLDIVALKTDGSVVRISDENEGQSFAVADLVKTTPGENPRLFVADFDNNGSNDIAISSGKQTAVYLSDEKSAFSLTPVQTIALRATDVADMNEDGILDFVGIGTDGKPAQALGKGTAGYHYVTLRPISQSKKKDKPSKGGDDRINSFGIGSELAVRAGLLVQKQLLTKPVAHFGIGKETQADYVRIDWPNGKAQGEFEIKGDATLVATQRLGGSCPFLFAWNGKEMAFVTDCIWRSPLGLKINAQTSADVAMTEDWVKIRGDQLQPRLDEKGNPYYDLRITADLWETHFFDKLALMPVDHPEGTDIFVDERFAIPPPPLKAIVTTPVTPVEKATADTGEDMTEIVRERDGVYADYFGRGQYQGVTRDHTLTLDLGAKAKSGKGPLYLIAYGWIHPTDSSINVAISQGSTPPPTGLSLEVPDGKGGWRAAKTGLGFPTGKVKTVVLRVDDILRGGTQLRLRTNLEIFWDSIGWARGVDNAPIQKTVLAPATAELRYRGFTRLRDFDKSSPELPAAYEPVETRAQKWRDLIGYYTRYGDVRELLTKVDDRYIIMNAGDEIRMRFATAPPPKPGFVRDYVLIGDGWVKDGNLNTIFSKTVLPLPTHAKADYSAPPKELEDDPVYKLHRADWEKYHTRYVAPDFFRTSLRPGQQ